MILTTLGNRTMMFSLLGPFLFIFCFGNTSYACECGTSSLPNRHHDDSSPTKSSLTARIFAGTEATPHEFPWMVYITAQRDGAAYNCGGSIISPTSILTAAHCVASASPGMLNITVGAHDKRKGQSVKAASVIVPPDYDATNSTHSDIAVVTLAKELQFNSKIAPICVAESDNEPFDVMEIAGWGRLGENKNAAETLQKTGVQYLDELSCYEAKYWFLVKKHNLDPKQRHNIPDIDSSHMCAKNTLTGGDFCRGDSGGPLMYRSSATQKYFAAGVASGHLDPCGNPQTPSFYTKVKNFRDFIQEHAPGVCFQPFDHGEI